MIALFHCDLAGLFGLHHIVAGLIVADRGPQRLAVFFKLIDGVHIGFGFHQPVLHDGRFTVA